MHEIPRQKLCELIAVHGRSLHQDRRRCEGLLQDVCGGHQQEVFVLMSALKENVATELLSTSDGVPKEVLLARLTKRLEGNLGFRGDVARWAVESWALALGKISQKEVEEAGASSPQPTAPVSPLPPTPTVQPPITSSPSQGTKNMSVLVLLVFRLITGDIYGAVWFLKRKWYFNGLRSSQRLGTAAPVFIIVMLIVYLLCSFAGGVAVGEGDEEAAGGFFLLAILVLVSASITNLILSFRARRMLDEHFNIYLGKGMPFSKGLTFLFQQLYLQYKLNRLPE